MRNSISKGISSWFAELSRSGGGVRAVKLALCAAVLAEAAGAQPSADWRIDTFAGRPAFVDGGPAVEAELYNPAGVAVDGAGNLYIADASNNGIRKVDSTGTITTIAGTGELGFSGDGGPAVEAELHGPAGVAVDSAGNLYIADTGNQRIRKVDSTGTITTIAGTGEFGFSGDGGPAVEAELRNPYGVAVDSAGNVYIADPRNRRIRKIDSTGTITTIAGTGEFGFSGDGGPAAAARLDFPYGVAVDSAGNVYIADTGNQRIRKIDSTGTITTIAGSGEFGFSGDGGPAVEAEFRNPYGVAVDSAGNLYIADTSNRRIRKIDSTGTITTIAGTGEYGFSGDGGPAVEAELSQPRGVAVDSAGNVYIADVNDHRIHKIDSTGTITTIAGTGFGFGGDGGPAAEAEFRRPDGVAVDSAGNLYIADSSDHRIRKVDSTGTITTIAGTGEYGFSGDSGPAIQAQLKYPDDVAVDSAGNVYIADSGDHSIRKVDSTGTITTIAGTGFGFSGDGGPAVEAELRRPRGVAVDSAGNVYIADSSDHRIRKVDSTGTITTIAGTGEFGFGGDGVLAAGTRLAFPYGVAVDSAGNLYIADTGNRRIRKIDSTGTITTIAGTGEFGFSGDGGPAVEAELRRPHGVAVDSAGNVYIADSSDHSIRKVDSTGTITTIAGTGEFGFSGDGGPAAVARLAFPRGVAVDSAGNLYIADSGNRRIRKLTPGGGSTPPNPTGPALTPGLPVSFSRGPVDSPTLFNGNFSYQLEVPEDATSVTFTLESVDPDIDMDLFVRYGEDIDLQNGRAVSDYSSEGLTGNEEIVITPQSDPPLRAGTYFVSVALFDTGVVAMATLRVEFDTPQQTGGPTYYFPHLAVGASWQTTITYINYSPQQVSCTTDFLSDQGSPLMVSFADRGTVVSRTDVLAPGGSVHQETNVELSAPLAPGWARAICSGPVKTSLLFRQHNSAGVPVAEAGVNAATVPATRFVTFVEQGEGKSGTGVAYANPSATSALVTFTAKNEAGQTLDSVVRTLLPGGHEAQNMVSLFGLSSFTGSLEVTSTAPIVSLSLNFEAAPVFSSLPPGELDAAAQGSTTYYFPHLAVGASWQTTITYINYSPDEVTCTTDFLSDQGAPLMVSFADRGTVVSRTDVLPPQGSVHQETNVQLNAPLAPGWARATCSGPVKASLLFRQHNSAGVPVAEAGVNAATVPATRFVTFAEQGEGQPGTGVAYANPSPTEAVITFTAKDEAGQTLDSVVRTLLPGGHEAQNMVSLFGLSSFIGSLEVATTAPIVSLSLNFEAAPVFSSLPPGELDASAQ